MTDKEMDKAKQKVQILMSTYNGTAYIRTQLESIVRLTGVEQTLLIRDDGSTDGTQEILNEYAEKYPWIHWFQGENIGVQKSFFELIQKADIEDTSIAYFSFADQDDEWLPEKLHHAILKIQEKERTAPTPVIPVLYCSDKYIVDEKLEPISVTVSRPVRKISFGNALVQNICTGCTAVINRELLRLIREHIPQNLDAVIMHDWWLYLTASCFGEVIYDTTPYIRYRQHGKNTSGAMLSKKGLFKYRMRQLLRPRGEIYRQVKIFNSSFSVPEKEKRLLYELLKAENSIVQRIRIIFTNKIYRQKLDDNFVLKGIILLGKL
ncbi:MAG: glycosyltransferase family 2 protein [bacterium]|nr:glycosyltransferase family 2 protein [bacterium]